MPTARSRGANDRLVACPPEAPQSPRRLSPFRADVISNFTAKMHIGDPGRVDAAIAHYEPHIDFDSLLAGL